MLKKKEQILLEFGFKEIGEFLELLKLEILLSKQQKQQKQEVYLKVDLILKKDS